MNNEEMIAEVTRSHRNSLPRPNKLRWAAWFFGGALAAVLVGHFVYAAYTEVETDNAFVDGHIIPVIPQVDGRVLHVFVDDNQKVKKGDRLVEIEPADYRIRRDQAQADLVSAKSELRKVANDLARYEKLALTKDVSEQLVDRTRGDVDSAKALVLRQQAALEKAELDLSRTLLTAPEDGSVTKKMVEERAYVRMGQPLLAVVPSNVWVVANFKETQLRRMSPMQHVEFTADAVDHRTYEGHVDSLQSGTGAAFSLLPPENATGNYVKVVQRIPVKIVIDSGNEDHRLVPGMSVTPKVRVR
jgi:membrane fusion protein (multidrug efflux system)